MKKGFDYQSVLGEGNPMIRFPSLYEAAVDEFSQRKWEEASLNDILRRAGVSKGSLYYHFGDKFGLYLAMCDIIISKKKEFFFSMMTGSPVPADFFEAMLVVSRATMAYMFMDMRLYRMTGLILDSGPELTQRLMPYFTDGLKDGFLPMIRAAVASGQIDSRYSAEFVSGITNILLTNLHRLAPSGSADDAMAMLERMIDMLRDGFSAKKEGRGQ